MSFNYDEFFDRTTKVKGGFRKIAEPTEKRCRDKEHNPPMHICLKPGIYEYVCPSCGETQIINVPLITL